MVDVSVLFLSHDRPSLFRRALWALVQRPPSVPFEVVVAADGLQQAVLDELRTYSGSIRWKFVRFAPGLQHLVEGTHTCEAPLVFVQDDDVIALGNCYDAMLKEASTGAVNWARDATTYELLPQHQEELDFYGANLVPPWVRAAARKPLCTESYREASYLRLCPRALLYTSAVQWESKVSMGLAVKQPGPPPKVEPAPVRRTGENEVISNIKEAK